MSKNICKFDIFSVTLRGFSTFKAKMPRESVVFLSINT
jgi:hypothetical protein